METNISFQDIKELLSQIVASSAFNEAKYAQQKAENEAKYAQQQAENEAKYAQQKAENEAKYAQLKENSKIEYDNLLKDLAKKEADLKAELDLKEDERRKEAEKQSKELNRKIDKISDSLGLYAETAVLEAVVKLFNNYGIQVKEVFPHAKRYDNRGVPIYEIDLIIYNTDYIIILEVKHKARVDDIKEHLERMEKIVENPLSTFKCKILLSGIASLVNNEHLERSAIAAGLFYLKPSGETVTLVNDKATFKQKEWRIDTERNLQE